MHRFPFVVLFAIVTSTSLVETADAETRGVLRVGVAPVALTPDGDTPLFGSRVDDAVRAYNAAADAYNQAHGYAPGSAMSTARIGRDDLGVASNFFTLAPGLEAGSRHAYFRLEAALAFGADHRSYGIGFYPLNLAFPMRRDSLTPYVSAGGSLSWLDDVRIDGEVGVLLGARFAAGVRIGQRVRVELGYNAYSIGGLVDRDQLDTMRAYDPRGSAPPPRPDSAIAGGEQRGAFDLSLGLAI
ncbi:MAG TPA: hypothetical protein VM261_04245 [Kofleriaceae bacterium]|nr:hypothetical protein [Kofleriaceae bacterium]